MKVLYLHQYFATPNSNGGTRSYEMAKRLVREGHEVEFITTSAFLEGQFKFENGWNEVNLDGIKLNIYHLPYSNQDSFFKRIIKFISFSIVSTQKSLKIESDIIFATSTPLTIGIPAVIYKKIKKVPMVFEVRDLWPDVPIAMGIISNPLIKWLLKKMEKSIYFNSAHVIALSPGMKKGVIETSYPEKNVTVIPNSCDIDLFDVDESHGINFKKELSGFINQRKVIVYPGTFGIVNNVSYLVHLAKEAKNQKANICFIAIGSGICKKQVISQAKHEGVFESNLKILDPIPKKELVNILSAADMCISLVGPTEAFWHNSANKVFDSLASKTPIAINHKGWQKEFIETSKCGLVLNDDYTSSVKKLESFLHDENRYNEAVNACKKLSKEDFSRNRLASKLIDVLESNAKRI